ncbi:MAG: two-component system sensor histidine kinase CreC [Acidobacteriota bacterium]|nr:two-component system sensor histidine kinase CreC [Acidobacteriota bacterium]
MKVLTRMMIAFLVTGVLGVVLVQFFMQEKLKDVYLRPIEDDLVDISMLIASMLQLEMQASNMSLLHTAEVIEQAADQSLDITHHNREKKGLSLHVYVTDRNRKVLYDSRDGKDVGETYDWFDVTKTLKGKYGARSTWDRSAEKARLWFYVGSPVMVDGEIMGVVSVGKQVPDLVPIWEDMRQEAMLGGLIAILFATVLGVFFIIWITRPIRMLTEYADLVRDGHRVASPVVSNSDIGRLGRSFDRMCDALEGKQYVEQYVQTLTHEIKSPLSAIRGAAELLEEDMPPERRAAFMGNIRTETERIQRLVERMLELSALEKKKELDNAVMVSVKEVVNEIAASLAPAAEARGISLVVDSRQDFRLEGDRFLVRQALANLVQNALHFTPRDGTITITLTEREITVRDTGPGVPDYARERVFDRFYSLRRPDSGKKSSGLGLSIVKQVAELHGCTVSLDNADEGGAIARFRLVAPRPKRGMRTIPPTRIKLEQALE